MGSKAGCRTTSRSRSCGGPKRCRSTFRCDNGWKNDGKTMGKLMENDGMMENDGKWWENWWTMMQHGWNIMENWWYIVENWWASDDHHCKMDFGVRVPTMSKLIQMGVSSNRKDNAMILEVTISGVLVSNKLGTMDLCSQSVVTNTKTREWKVF